MNFKKIVLILFGNKYKLRMFRGKWLVYKDKKILYRCKTDEELEQICRIIILNLRKNGKKNKTIQGKFEKNEYGYLQYARLSESR